MLLTFRNIVAGLCDKLDTKEVGLFHTKLWSLSRLYTHTVSFTFTVKCILTPTKVCLIMDKVLDAPHTSLWVWELDFNGHPGYGHVTIEGKKVWKPANPFALFVNNACQIKIISFWKRSKTSCLDVETRDSKWQCWLHRNMHSPLDHDWFPTDFQNST